MDRSFVGLLLALGKFDDRSLSWSVRYSWCCSSLHGLLLSFVDLSERLACCHSCHS